MLRKNYLSKVVMVLKQGDKFIQNPEVIADKWIDNGEIVYGESVTGAEAQKARELAKTCSYDFFAAGCGSQQDSVDIYEPVPALSDEIDSRGETEEEILLGFEQERPFVLAGGEHVE